MINIENIKGLCFQEAQEYLNGLGIKHHDPVSVELGLHLEDKEYVYLQDTWDKQGKRIVSWYRFYPIETSTET